MSFNEKMDGALFPMGLVAPQTPQGLGTLVNDHGQCPFSVLNTQHKSWQRRKRAWVNLGIQSELGRKEGMTYSVPDVLSDGRAGSKMSIETSVFDPLLTELAYSWFCPPGGVVLDPFAGGSVRGVVAAVLGYRYYGIELRAEQVGSNEAQAGAIKQGLGPLMPTRPKWVVGDSMEVVGNAPKSDFIFSCPPYGNLEVYSDEEGDISNMDHDDFAEAYKAIIYRTCRRLKDDRFACFVVGNYRDKEDGRILNLVGLTCDAFTATGMGFYNDAVLINAYGTAGVRTGNTFERGNRKLVKCHQNVLVFVKGCPKKAAAAIKCKNKEMK